MSSPIIPEPDQYAKYSDVSTCKRINSILVMPPTQLNIDSTLPKHNEPDNNRAGLAKEAIKPTSRHWGNVIPLLINKHTQVPLLTLNRCFYKAYIANIVAIIIICLVLPLSHHNLASDHYQSVCNASTSAHLTADGTDYHQLQC